MADRTDRDAFGHSNDKLNSAAPTQSANLSEFTKASPYPETRCDTRQTEESDGHPIPLSVAANIPQPNLGVRRLHEFASGPAMFTRADRQAERPIGAHDAPANPVREPRPARAVHPLKIQRHCQPT
ncbi:hypothetical protein OHA40_19030 [Nocardia sp. NBC_00508]|uniref:hypothetical protein n=1 Tax=Nocardia sp. NBC_00508 TaxID=2975992 RepID=UPI002E806925|nr:hypothetical protein [Nocardia sp. NBC_00508]WUD63841.1 hypothetical protein OHA40_19030 [Nocardia sp. NBC_00508]